MYRPPNHLRPRIQPPMSVAAPSQLSASFLDELTALVGPENVLRDRDELIVYECDGYVINKNVPDVVVFPTSTEHVVGIVRLCNEHDIRFVPRGAGTSLAGGALAVGRGA